jgi:phosphomannomutase
VVLDLEGDARICVRPSGTEPKLKLYVHLCSDFSVGDDFAAVEESGRDEATSLARALADELGA